MKLSDLSARLQELLGLERSPVAMAFVDKPPVGVPTPAKAAPSACSFWREAERGLFFASADLHFNCPIGAMVMGFELPAEVGAQLTGLVGSMCQQGYLGADEASSIPTVDRGGAGIVYGPLAGFRPDPDLILMWLNPAQAMLFAEAAGAADWTGQLLQVSGRPGCATLPLSLRHERPGVSLGCAGMRTFTGIEADQMLAIVPGAQGGQFTAALERLSTANAAMASYYSERAAQFS